MARTTIRAGMVVRGYVRAAVHNSGVEWREEKGFLESFFYITGTQEQVDALSEWVARLNERIKEQTK